MNIKNTFLTLIAVSTLVLTGCKTVPTQTQQQKINAAVQSVAAVGGSLILSQNPNLRSGFEQAVLDLKVIESTTNNISINDVLGIVQRLDIKQLQSSTAVLYISTGILLITEFNIPTALPLDQSNSAREIAHSLRIGLESALSAVPVKVSNISTNTLISPVQ